MNKYIYLAGGILKFIYLAFFFWVYTFFTMAGYLMVIYRDVLPVIDVSHVFQGTVMTGYLIIALLGFGNQFFWAMLFGVSLATWKGDIKRYLEGYR